VVDVRKAIDYFLAEFRSFHCCFVENEPSYYIDSHESVYWNGRRRLSNLLRKANELLGCCYSYSIQIAACLASVLLLPTNNPKY
jgi:hypothetical protein